MPGLIGAALDVAVHPEPTRRDGCLDHERPTSGSSPVRAARRALSRPRTKLDPTQREVRYPTRASVDRLPKTDGLRITFLIAKYMPVCGGIISVVQLARELLLAGHDVKLVTECEELNPERFNLPCQPLVYPNREELLRLFPPSDVVVATFWTTAYDYLPELRRRYDLVSVYFVQDYEVFFYPESDLEHRSRVAQTYAMSEHRIVKSSWLKNLIESKHGVPCEKVHIGLDLAVFRNRKVGDRLGRPPRVLSVARPGETRRGFKEVVKVFGDVHQSRRDVEFAFFGTPDDLMPKDLPFPLVNAGRIEDQGKVAELIASCDVLVDSSLFQGFGRPGLEAMACGTACVLTSEGGVNEYARNDENCLLVRPRDNEAMAKAVMRLLDDDPLRARLRMAGLATAEQYCHRDEARLHLQYYRRWLREKYGAERGLMESCTGSGVPHRRLRGSEVPR
jgi:glycosyltransferase involved in cell wall biosynthesis